ncbi:MAG: queuosine precursor transporter [Actinobacteria bacterium]|nr:queuosine precursor transporter [Actinomycetota bacterium]
MSSQSLYHRSLYPIIAAVFCALLLISNIGATKFIDFGFIKTDGGAFLFPLVYILGDILTEVYGFKAARRVIYTGFGLGALAGLAFWLVQIAPAASDWPNQGAFESILGFVPQIVMASITAFLLGQLANSWTLVKIKKITKEKKLWARLIGSTAVGELVDTIVFTMIASLGRLSFDEFLNYLVVGYLYKTLVEVALLPITYPVIAYVKKREVEAAVS